MNVKRFEIVPLPQRNFNFAVGVPQKDREAYNLSVVLAALVRQLLGATGRSHTMVIGTEAIKEIVEQGAWLEIAQDGEDMILRTTLK